MASENLRPVFLSMVTGLAWAVVVVLLVAPAGYSLSMAGAMLIVVALAGWVLEARESSLHDESDVPGPSAWPVALAVGCAGLAGGLVFDGGRIGLVLALPWALLSTLSWSRVLRLPGRARAGSDTQMLSSREIEARTAGGYAVAVERTPPSGVSRRTVLRAGAGLGIVSTILAALGSVVDYLWARDVEAFGGIVDAGPAERFPPGTKTKIQEGRFWLVSLTEEQGGPGYVALWQKCPHLGCTVPWLENFPYVDPRTGEEKKGWFRCPCHQSTYDDAGVRVYGPAPRSMDRMHCTVNADTGRIEVDTGRLSKGSGDNATHAASPLQ